MPKLALGEGFGHIAKFYKTKESRRPYELAGVALIVKGFPLIHEPGGCFFWIQFAVWSYLLLSLWHLVYILLPTLPHNVRSGPLCLAAFFPILIPLLSLTSSEARKYGHLNGPLQKVNNSARSEHLTFLQQSVQYFEM
uniref:Uncharacterized protein n=1 Tax=Glossina austeni TaxID=7395 RepID=A0A1A9VPD7_GLOAU